MIRAVVSLSKSHFLFLLYIQLQNNVVTTPRVSLESRDCVSLHEETELKEPSARDVRREIPSATAPHVNRRVQCGIIYAPTGQVVLGVAQTRVYRCTGRRRCDTTADGVVWWCSPRALHLAYDLTESTTTPPSNDSESSSRKNGRRRSGLSSSVFLHPVFPSRSLPSLVPCCPFCL